MTTHTQWGVTLVELLVVIAVIAILAAFFAVRMFAVRTGAEEDAARATAASLATSVSSFYLANGCYPRDVGGDTIPSGMASYVGGQWPVGFDYEQWGNDIGISWRPNGSYRWTVWVTRGVAVPICS
jgi:prepilin-type N-terminal cleavage/methylation domain-containing protein